MIRIWAKVIKNEKIVKETIFEEFDTFKVELFYDYISQICEKANAPRQRQVLTHKNSL